MIFYVVSRGVAGHLDPLRCWWDKYTLWEVEPIVNGVAASHRDIGQFDTEKEAQDALALALATAPRRRDDVKTRRPKPGEGWRGMDRVRLHKAKRRD